MKKKLAFLALAVLVAGYVGASSYVVSSQGIQSLLVCSADGGLKIPFAKKVCQYYLFNSRGSSRDISNLQKYGGASFVLNEGPVTPNMRKTLSFLLARGLDINGPDESGIRPLQGAVLENSLAKVNLILSLGGNPGLTGSAIKLTPLQLAINLKRAHKLRHDNSKIIARLRRAAEAAQQVGPTAAHAVARSAGD